MTKLVKAAEVLARTEENGTKLNMLIVYKSMKLINNTMAKSVEDRKKVAKITTDNGSDEVEKIKFLLKAIEHQEETKKIIHEGSELVDKMRELNGLETYDEYASITDVEVDENNELIPINPLIMIAELVRGVKITSEMEALDDANDLEGLEGPTRNSGPLN